MKRIGLIVAAAAAVLPSFVLGQDGPWESAERLRDLAGAHARRTAESFVTAGARIEADVSRLDSRLRLAACPRTPETFDPPGGGTGGANLSVGVRCPVSPGWSLYVPVRLEIVTDVVVLAQPIARDEPLTEAALTLEPRDVSRLTGGYLTALEQAEGMLLRRPVRPGTALTATLLERPDIVHRGQRVHVVASGGTLAVRGEGEALADAAEGERVRVRNLGSRRVVEGVVEADGRVRIGG